MALWNEDGGQPHLPLPCKSCKGKGTVETTGFTGVKSWGPCLTCHATGIARPRGPVDAMEEECSRG